MIEVSELTKRYRQTTAVKNLTFTVRPGHVTGFLGPDGAGKTTTVEILEGFRQRTEGQVSVHSRGDP